MPNGQNIVDPLSLNLYTYCHNNPVLYVDTTGHWIHIAVGALIGCVFSAGIELFSQLRTADFDFEQVDVGLVFISGFSGAIGGALAATGVGAVAAGAIVGGVQSMAEQAYAIHKTGSGSIDLLEIGVSLGVGALTGSIGGVLSGFASFPTIPQNHFSSMSDALFKRLGNAVKYHLGKGALKEIANAIGYYYSQTATLMWRTIIRTVMIEVPRDNIIQNIIDATGLPRVAKDELRKEVYNNR